MTVNRSVDNEKESWHLPPMYSYTKLFSSIITSSVWRREPHTTKVVWITILAMKDKRTGVVYSSIPGLADMAGVTLEECEEALKSFLSPDPYSRTKDYEGRKLLEVDGGWWVVNHEKYKDLMRSEERTDYLREKKRESRERQQSQQSQHGQPKSTDTDTDTKTDTKTKKKDSRSSGDDQVLIEGFEEFWAIYPRKVAKPEARKAWKQMKCHEMPLSQFAATIEGYKKTRQWQDKEKIPHAATWLRREGWNDEVPEPMVKGLIDTSGLDEQQRRNIQLRREARERRANEAAE